MRQMHLDIPSSHYLHEYNKKNNALLKYTFKTSAKYNCKYQFYAYIIYIGLGLQTRRQTDLAKPEDRINFRRSQMQRRVKSCIDTKRVGVYNVKTITTLQRTLPCEI